VSLYHEPVSQFKAINEDYDVTQSNDITLDELPSKREGEKMSIQIKVKKEKVDKFLQPKQH
jgi:hypothetical protein